jgi:hypothetical protein
VSFEISFAYEDQSVKYKTKNGNLGRNHPHFVPFSWPMMFGSTSCSTRALDGREKCRPEMRCTRNSISLCDSIGDEAPRSNQAKFATLRTLTRRGIERSPSTLWIPAHKLAERDHAEHLEPRRSKRMLVCRRKPSKHRHCRLV